VIAWLRSRVELGTYREAGKLLGVDFALLNKVIRGHAPLSESMARAAGFVAVGRPERKWRRKS
jgi:hypothetical protein